jgi:hypothetical protein
MGETMGLLLAQLSIPDFKRPGELHGWAG